MAVVGPASVIQQYVTGGADIIGLYALRNVTAGDTIDMAALGAPVWQQVKRGVVLGISDFVEIAATFAGTVVTMPSGLANSSAYLLIWGC